MKTTKNKSVKTLTILVGVGITLTSASFGQRPGGPPPFAMALPSVYETLALADSNADRKLDADEQAALADAVSKGTFKKPKGLPKAPKGKKLKPADLVERLAELYADIAPFDKDEDGKLQEDEIPALREAFMNGEIRPPFAIGRPDNGERSRK